MKKFVLHTGLRRDGERGYALKPPTKLSQVEQKAPATREDIHNLQETLSWPPDFLKDVNVLEMDRHRRALNSIMEDPHMHPTEKLLSSRYHAQLFALYNDKFFNSGEKIEKIQKLDPPVIPRADETTGVIPGGAEQASVRDLKKLGSLIPRPKSGTMPFNEAMVDVPEHKKDKAQKILQAINSPKSKIKIDSQGKIIDHRGLKARVIPNTNIQNILSFATDPGEVAIKKIPKGYDLVRESLKDAGLTEQVLSPVSENIFRKSTRESTPKRPISTKKKKIRVTPMRL